MNLLCLDEVFDEKYDDFFRDDGEIAVFGAVCTFTRRDLNRTQDFFEVVVPTYPPDVFSSHFPMTRGTFAELCRVISRTGRINTNNAFGRQPIPHSGNKNICTTMELMYPTPSCSNVSD